MDAESRKKPHVGLTVAAIAVVSFVGYFASLGPATYLYCDVWFEGREGAVNAAYAPAWWLAEACRCDGALAWYQDLWYAEPWFRKYIQSPEAREIERNLGITP